MIMAASIDQAGRKVNLDAADGVSGRDRQAALEFDVLSDEGLKVAQAFGLVFTLPSYLEDLYRSFGNTLDTFHGGPPYRLPLPARYVVDRQGQIRAADVNADYTVRPDPEETLAQLRGLSVRLVAPASDL
jgi:peroxiredoxin